MCHFKGSTLSKAIACNEYHIFIKNLRNIFTYGIMTLFLKIPETLMEDSNFKAFDNFLF